MSTEIGKAEYTTGDPEEDYRLGWEWANTVPPGASSDFAQGVNDRGWAVHDGRSTKYEDSPRAKNRAERYLANTRRDREINYMMGRGR